MKAHAVWRTGRSMRRCMYRCIRSDVSGRELAVKKLSDLETTSSARRVYNELCALTHLRHENVRPASIPPEPLTHEPSWRAVVSAWQHRAIMQVDIDNILSWWNFSFKTQCRHSNRVCCLTDTISARNRSVTRYWRLQRSVSFVTFNLRMSISRFSGPLAIHKSAKPHFMSFNADSKVNVSFELRRFLPRNAAMLARSWES